MMTKGNWACAAHIPFMECYYILKSLLKIMEFCTKSGHFLTHLFLILEYQLSA